MNAVVTSLIMVSAAMVKVLSPLCLSFSMKVKGILYCWSRKTVLRLVSEDAFVRLTFMSRASTLVSLIQ